MHPEDQLHAFFLGEAGDLRQIDFAFLALHDVVADPAHVRAVPGVVHRGVFPAVAGGEVYFLLDGFRAEVPVPVGPPVPGAAAGLDPRGVLQFAGRGAVQDHLVGDQGKLVLAHEEKTPGGLALALGEDQALAVQPGGQGGRQIRLRLVLAFAVDGEVGGAFSVLLGVHAAEAGEGRVFAVKLQGDVAFGVAAEAVLESLLADLQLVAVHAGVLAQLSPILLGIHDEFLGDGDLLAVFVGEPELRPVGVAVAVVAVHVMVEGHALPAFHVHAEFLGLVLARQLAQLGQLGALEHQSVAEVQPGPVPEVGLGESHDEALSLDDQRTAADGALGDRGQGRLQRLVLLGGAEAVRRVPAFVILVEKIIRLVGGQDVLFLVLGGDGVADRRALVVHPHHEANFPFREIALQLDSVFVAFVAVFLLDADHLGPGLVDLALLAGFYLAFFRPGLVLEFQAQFAADDVLDAEAAQGVGDLAIVGQCHFQDALGGGQFYGFRENGRGRQDRQ